MSSLKDALHKRVQLLTNALKPVPTVSTFLSDGKLTPVEFVMAGDALVQKCPTWQWQHGSDSGRVGYLPADRQFLLTRNGKLFLSFFFFFPSLVSRTSR